VEELREALTDARDDASVRVLILTGAGEKAFVAGADIGELSQQTPVNGKEFSLFGQGVFHLLETMGQALDLRDQWICVGRRLRTGVDVLDSNCQ